MNPEDRFMNPRQPPKPKMPPRVRTSLQQPAPAWNFRNSPLSMITNRTTSLPSSPTDKPRSRNSRESFVSKSSRSLSPPRSRGMHGALHCLNATTPNQPIAKYKEFDVTRPGAAHGPGPRRGDQQHQHVAAHPHPRGFHLPYPRNHEPLSIQDRRALKSKPRDPSPFRNPLTVNTRSDRVETAFSHQNDVPSLRAIAQEIAVSGDSTTPTPFGFKDKRLPTLPNTPSSVMDEALEDLEERERALAAEKLESHFSDFSATDESSGSHSPRYEKSRFSEWSSDTDQQQHPSGSFNSLPSFPRVEHPPSPVFEDVETPSYLRPAHAHGHAHAHAADCSDPDTPHLTVNSQPSPAISMPSNSPDLQLPVPRVAVAGSGSPGGDLDISNLSVQDDDHDGNDHADDNDDDASSHVETNPKRHAAFFGAFDPVKGLGLSSSNPENSRRILSEAVERERAGVPGGVPGSGSGSGSGRDEKSRDGHPSQSATMKEMMDELSYLKNMIQSEQVISQCQASNPTGKLHSTRQTLPKEKTLTTKCKPNMLTYCPTMDLIAVVGAQDEHLSVYRLNGQRVFGGSFEGEDDYGLDMDDGGGGQRNDGEIRGVRWKNNGHLLAVACADDTIRVISSYSGKTVHHYAAYSKHQISEDNTATVPTTVNDEDAGDGRSQDYHHLPNLTCLGWGINFTDSKSAQRYLHEAAGQISVQDLLAPDVHPAKAAALLKADLPRELALLDVESSLPKLSTLPATGSDDDVFSARASLDAIFHSGAKNTSDSVDVLLAGFDNGTVHLRIFDCFEIGSFQIGQACSLLQHASHPLSSTHALLASSASSLHLLTIDLRFITKSGRYLSLLAHKTTQLQNLLRYIGQVQRQIELEWKNAQELPMRYMRSVNSDLQEKCHCDFVTAAYHLVVTGDCFEPLKEFLVDIVGERGHKRWDKAVSSGYENVRRLTHECLLPALDRCEVVLSRLIGLSKFQKLSDVLGLETSDLNGIMETLDCLHLLAHHIIINTNEELGQFVSFSKWLRHEIDLQSAEPMSQTLEDLLEKTDLMEYPQTLKYIQGALANSALRKFIQQLPMMGVPRPSAPPASTDADKWAPTGHAHDRSFYEMFKKLLQQQQQSQEHGQGSGSGSDGVVELPKLNDLTKRLGLQFEKVFGQIALTQRRGILHRSPLVLHEDCDRGVIDMAMRYEDTDEGSFGSVYITTRSVKSGHVLYIYRVVLDSVNGVSSTRTTSAAAFDLQEGEILQLQFVEDDTLMILWSHQGSTNLLNLPFQPTTVKGSGVANRASSEMDLATDVDVEYEPCKAKPSTSAQPCPTVVSLDVLSPDGPHVGLIKHSFTGPRNRPIRVDVNGRAGRRAVCALYADGMRYEVFDLDAAVDDDDDDNDI